MTEQKIRSLEPSRPEEQDRVLDKELVREVFGDEIPEPVTPSKAKRGDVVRIRGRLCVVLERRLMDRQGRRTNGIVVLQEIDGVIFTASYFTEDRR